MVFDYVWRLSRSFKLVLPGLFLLLQWGTNAIAQPTLVQVIETSQWSPPSPDPSGIVYIPTLNRLLVSDGEVNEMTIYAGVNIWEISLTGGQIQEFTTVPSFSDEPTGVTYNPGNGHLFFTDDTGTPRTVYELDPGSDGDFFTSDDIITSFSTSAFGSADPEGITFDPNNGHLFIADGVNAEVYEVDPGSNGVFDGVFPSGDDVVTQFDVLSLGITNPEGIAYNYDRGTLHLIGSATGDESLLETTTTGTAINFYDITSYGMKNPAGLTYGPSSGNAAERSIYVVTRGVDNNSDPNENDGKLYEIGLGLPTPGLAIDNVSIAEGGSGTTEAIFTVSLSSGSSEMVTVQYTTSDGSATVTDNDYEAAAGQVKFQPGETSQQIIIEINGDGKDEGDETFFIDLSNADHANIADDQGIGTILDDDGSQPITVSYQDGTNGYSGTRDTKLKIGTPDTNYGSDETLEVDGDPDESSLLFWDLSDITNGSTILSVDITVNVTNVSGADYEIYDLKKPWIENEASWNEASNGQSWEVPGADGSSDRGSVAFGAIVGSNSGSNSTSLNAAGIATVQSWVDDPSTNHGFIIQDYINHNNDVNFSSRETAAVSERPRLTVTYTPAPEPQPEPQAGVMIVESGDPPSTDVEEGGDKDFYEVVLKSKPGSTVLVYMKSDDQVNVWPWLMLFTEANWDEPRRVTVKAVDDSDAEPTPHHGTIRHEARSKDSDYDHISIDDLTVNIKDNDLPAGVTITESGDPQSTDVTEGGDKDYYEVVLNSKPSRSVELKIKSDDQVEVYPSKLKFKEKNWDEPQKVWVKAVDDEVNEPSPHQGKIRHEVSSKDRDYDDIAVRDIMVNITDNDPQNHPVTVSFKDGKDGYHGTRDTKLLSGKWWKNYGDDDKLELDGHPDRSALLSWNLEEIPQGSIIKSVEITVYVTNSSGHTYEFYELKRPWVEDEATWKEYADGKKWQEGGADGADDRGSTKLAFIKAKKKYNTISLNDDGVSLVQKWIDDPSSNHGFIILDYKKASNAAEFYSSEARKESKRPEITITYVPSASPGPLALMATSESIATTPVNLPETISLSPNYPNPFNLETRIQYSLPEETQVKLLVFNLRGQVVKELVNGMQSPGYKNVIWNGLDNFGREVGSGVYFIRLIADKQSFVRKVSLLK